MTDETYFNECVTVRFTLDDLRRIDKIVRKVVRSDIYENRSDFIRSGALMLIRKYEEVYKNGFRRLGKGQERHI